MRIGEFKNRQAFPAAPGATIVPGLSAAAAVEPADIRFRDLPIADSEAGQDKLRSAVEWGVLHRRLQGRNIGPLLNLKRACPEGFFPRGQSAPGITGMPDDTDPEAWIRTLPQASFDVIFGLDFFQLHGNPRSGIGDLGALLKPDGILFADFFSAEHFALAGSLPAPAHRGPVRDRAAIPGLLLSPGDIGEMARAAGLRVSGIVPYSAFYGNSLWLEMMESRFRWERILDWLSADPILFDCALFLEESIVARLGAACAPRFIAVLEKNGKPGPSGADSERPGLHERIGIPKPELDGAFASHGKDARNLVFMHHLWRLAEAHLTEAACPGWKGLLPSWIAEEYAGWLAQEGLDAKGMRTVNGWHEIPEVSRALRHRGIPLGPGLQYEQVRGMLADVFGCFRRGRR